MPNQYPPLLPACLVKRIHQIPPPKSQISPSRLIQANKPELQLISRECNEIFLHILQSLETGGVDESHVLEIKDCDSED